MRKLGDHPHVVSVLDTGEEDGNPFIVSEYMPGGDVEAPARRRRAAGSTVDRAVEIAADVTRALEHAHARGIVHRDLKPANVWLDDDGHARLGDFGLATTEGRSRVSGGTLVGTVAYLPPEQALGEAAGPESDLYSLGALLYEMLTGQPAVPRATTRSRSSASTCTPTRCRPRATTPRCPRRSTASVLGLLAKRREDRPVARPPRRASGCSAALEEPPAEPAAERAGRTRSTASPAASSSAASASSSSMREAVDCGARRAAARCSCWSASRGSARRAPPRSSPPTRGSAARASTGGAAARTRAPPPTGPGCRRSATYVRDSDPVGAGLADGRRRGRDRPARPRGRRAPRHRAAPSRTDSEEARFRLFDSVTSFLVAAARDRPMVLVLDDLHWADEPSLLLLKYAAAEIASSGLLISAPTATSSWAATTRSPGCSASSAATGSRCAASTSATSSATSR